jgi:hypothetical protein
LRFDPHALLYQHLTGSDVGAAVHLDQALEADPHAAKQPPRFASPARQAKHALAVRQEGSGDSVAVVSREFATIEGECQGPAASNGIDAP